MEIYLQSIITIIIAIATAAITSIVSIVKLGARVQHLEDNRKEMESTIIEFRREFNEYCMDVSKGMAELIKGQELLKKEFDIYFNQFKGEIDKLIDWKDRQSEKT